MTVPAGLLHAAQMQRYTSPGEVLETYVLQSGGAHFGCELGRGGKLADGFGEVTISVRRTGDEAADDREYAPAVKVVDGCEQAVRRCTEFQDGRHAARAKDAAHFREAGLVVGQIAKSEGDGHQVERRVTHRERQRVGF